MKIMGLGVERRKIYAARNWRNDGGEGGGKDDRNLGGLTENAI